MPVKRADAAARDAHARRLRTHALALEHPDPRLVEAVERAKASLLDAAAGAPACALAAIVVGEWDQAVAAIERLLDPPGRAQSGVIPAGLISQLYAWSGDAPRVRPWVARGLAALERAAESGDRRVIAREMLALAEATGQPDAARRLRTIAGGADPHRSGGDVLLREMAVMDAARAASHARAAASLARMAEAFTAGQTDEAAKAWTECALADDEGDPTLLPFLAAGLLGLDPDAERGRIRARLHVPVAWPQWSVTAIRTGEALFEIRVSRDERRVEIRTEQTDGPLPLTLILEPTVHAPIRAARVDGQKADLAYRPYPDRVVAPVQLVLDQDRTLTLELDS